MSRLYLRWGGVLAIGIVIGALGLQRYQREVMAFTPERILSDQPTETVRVLGRVEAGSLVKAPSQREITFQLAGEKDRIAVRYSGEEPEGLRELKTLVVVGRWDGATHELKSQKTDLIPNYGFITAAYLIALIPTGLFLFNMERKVAMLYTLIKQEKVYQPEDHP